MQKTYYDRSRWQTTLFYLQGMRDRETMKGHRMNWETQPAREPGSKKTIISQTS